MAQIIIPDPPDKQTLEQLDDILNKPEELLGRGVLLGEDKGRISEIFYKSDLKQISAEKIISCRTLYAFVTLPDDSKLEIDFEDYFLYKKIILLSNSLDYFL